VNGVGMVPDVPTGENHFNNNNRKP